MDVSSVSLLGIGLSILMFMILAFRGFSVLVIAPISVIIIAAFGGPGIVKVLTGPFMVGMTNFAKSYFLIFLFSALFGQVMSDSGAARSIGRVISDAARRSRNHRNLFAVLSLPLINALLTYSGISLYVVVFTLVAIARNLFKELNIPWHLYAVSCLGTGAFTMTMLPGTPAITNLIPLKYFGTTAMAAPTLGVVLAIVDIAITIIYIKWAIDRCAMKGEGFMETGHLIDQVALEEETDSKQHPLWKCLLPLTVPVIAMNVFQQNPAISLIFAIISVYILFYSEFKNIKATLNQGAASGIVPLISVCVAVGFGSAIAAVPGFKILTDTLTTIPGPPLTQLVLAVYMASLVTGSAAGGLTIGLDAVANTFVKMGMDGEIAHRMSAIASCGGVMPHNASVINTLTITKLNHKSAYKHYFMIDVVIQTSVLIIGVFLVQLGVK